MLWSKNLCYFFICCFCFSVLIFKILLWEAMQSVMPFEFNLCLCFFGNRQIRWKVAWKPLKTNTKHPDFVLSIANNSISVTVLPLTYAVCPCRSIINVHWCRNSEGFWTVFIFWICIGPSVSGTIRITWLKLSLQPASLCKVSGKLLFVCSKLQMSHLHRIPEQRGKSSTKTW